MFFHRIVFMKIILNFNISNSHIFIFLLFQVCGLILLMGPSVIIMTKWSHFKCQREIKAAFRQQLGPATMCRRKGVYMFMFMRRSGLTTMDWAEKCYELSLFHILDTFFIFLKSWWCWSDVLTACQTRLFSLSASSMFSWKKCADVQVSSLSMSADDPWATPGTPLWQGHGGVS